MKGDYFKTELSESFDLARLMHRAFKTSGYDAPPVLAIERELKKIRAQAFIRRRRREQIIYRYERGTNRKEIQ